ncbi:MAG: iron ABC transporter permease [Tepidisphaeraceae bacterium]|jgi:iron(III) transport system permease protein
MAAHQTSSSRGSTGHRIAAAIICLFFAAFLIWPIWQTLRIGFTQDGHFSAVYIQMIVSDPQLMRGLFNAAMIGITVMFLSLAIALPLAVLSVRYSFPGRDWLAGLLLAPLVLPPFVGAIGVRLLLGRFGPLTMLLGLGHGAGFDWIGRYRMLGIIVVEALHLYPVMLLNLQAALANIDPGLEQAAANLGASRWRVFRKITLPLLRPGLFAGCTLTLIWSFTELGTPLIFDFNTVTPVQIFWQITQVASNPLPYALVVVMLAAAGLLYLLGKVLLGGGAEASASKGIVGASVAQPLHGLPALAASGLFIVVLIFALLPHAAVILTSVSATGQWYRSVLPREFTLNHYTAALLDDLAIPSVRNSVMYATCATIVAVAIGLTAAVVIVRSRLRIRGFIDVLSMLPLAVPGLVLAFGYLAIGISLKQKYGPSLPVWLDVQERPTIFLILAYAVRRLPYVVRATAAGLQQTPRDLELAAENLGASHARTLWKITFPFIAGNLIAGALLAFAFALLDVSDSLILAQKAAYYPITRAILELAQRMGDGLYIASALGVWAMLLLTFCLLAAGSMVGKRWIANAD